MPRSRLLDPKLDLVFKRVFTQSPDLLMDLINAVRPDEPPISELNILNPQILPEEIETKAIVLDILARDTSGQALNIEMQTRQHMGLPARMVFYLARLLSRQLGAGEGWHLVKPAISITLMDFNLFPAHDKCVWTFELRDGQHPEVVLDRSLQMHLIEMPKADRLPPSRSTQVLVEWVKWFRHWDEETIMQQIQHPAIQKAHQHLHAVSADEQAWIQALQRERTLMIEALWKAQEEAGKAQLKADQAQLDSEKTRLDSEKTRLDSEKTQLDMEKTRLDSEKTQLDMEKTRLHTEKARLEAEKAKTLAIGEAKGQTKGQAALLQHLLHMKFGQLPASVEQRLQHAGPAQLTTWGERVLSAHTLEQVFGGH